MLYNKEKGLPQETIDKWIEDGIFKSEEEVFSVLTYHIPIQDK